MKRRAVTGWVLMVVGLVILGVHGYQFALAATPLNLATFLVGAVVLVVGGYLLAVPGRP